MLTPAVAQKNHPGLPPVAVPVPRGTFSYPAWRRLATRAPLGLRRVATHAQKESPRERVIVSLLPLVHRVAHTIRRHLPAYAAVETDDLVAAGVVGLIDALNKFDASRQTKVEHYAVFRIRGAILDCLRGWDTAPRPLRRISKAVQRVGWELEAKLGRSAEEGEMARALGMTLDRWHTAVRDLRATGIDWRSSLSVVGASKADGRETAREPGDGATPFDVYARHERSALVAQAVDGLPERERQVVAMYYRDDLTQKQIGAKLSLSEARICQLRYAALHRLRKIMLHEVRSPRYIL